MVLLRKLAIAATSTFITATDNLSLSLQLQITLVILLAAFLLQARVFSPCRRKSAAAMHACVVLLQVQHRKGGENC